MRITGSSSGNRTDPQDVCLSLAGDATSPPSVLRTGDAGPGAEAGREQDQPGGAWGIGALAQRSGVTVRTLRHDDQTGLLRPSRRDRAGRRVYDRDDVERLYRVLALRRLRSSLAQIRSVLDEPGWDTAATVARHSAETERALAATARQSTLLRSVSAQITATGDASPDQLSTTMEEMTMLETPIRGTTTLLVHDDVRAAHHARALQHGAQAVTAPVDQPYGVREHGARDLEGHLWCFHSPSTDQVRGSA